jgi:predicted PurR-regulated permease PerM
MDEEKQIYVEPKRQGVLDVSWETIVKIIFSLTTLYFFFLVRDILIWFVFALIISILFNPAINFLRKFRIFKKFRMPRTLATIIVYLVLFLILAVGLYFVFIFLLNELKIFIDQLPDYLNQLTPYLEFLEINVEEDFNIFSNGVRNILSGASNNIFTAMAAFFGGLVSTFSIFAIAFFLSLEQEGLAHVVELASPQRYKNYIKELWKKTQKKIASWFGVRIICCLFIGLSASAITLVLKIPYAAFFGLLAGFSNIVITIGPLFSGLVIALFILAVGSLEKALIFVIAFFLAQEIENYVLMPVLTKKYLRLSPSLVLISLLIGAKLWGILGAILAIPLVGMIYEFIKGFLERRHGAET